MEITSLSSKGQIVIPQDIREQLSLKIGEKFIVIGKSNTIILKKIQEPSFKNFDNLLKETQKFIKEKNIKKKDLRQVIGRVRKR